jgi:hypothetical protein
MALFTVEENPVDRAAVKAQRQKLRDELAGYKEIGAEYRQMMRRRDDIEARVQTGELGSPALNRIDEELAVVRRRMDRARTGIPHELFATAPDDLHQQFRAALEDKAKANVRAGDAKLAAEKAVQAAEGYKRQIETAKNREGWPDTDKRTCNLQYEQLLREQRATERELADAVADQQSAIDHVEEIRQACIDAD